MDVMKDYMQIVAARQSLLLFFVSLFLISIKCQNSTALLWVLLQPCRR